MMRTPNTWKKPMYVAVQPYSNELDSTGKRKNEIEKPIKLELNYQPVKSDTALREFGANDSSMYRAIVHQGTKEFELFDLLDGRKIFAYLNGASPNVKPYWYELEDDETSEQEPVNGLWANYEVYSVRHSNMTKTVYFKEYKTTGVG